MGSLCWTTWTACSNDNCYLFCRTIHANKCIKTAISTLQTRSNWPEWTSFGPIQNKSNKKSKAHNTDHGRPFLVCGPRRVLAAPDDSARHLVHHEQRTCTGSHVWDSASVDCSWRVD